MRHREFYRKYMTSYSQPANPIFHRSNLYAVTLIACTIPLMVALIAYGRQRPVMFSLPQYVRLSEYFLLPVFPFVIFLFWFHWRESKKRKRGYVLVGKFEVIGKQSSLFLSYLLLAPGGKNKIKVGRDLFEKIQVGDCIEIRRDALGTVQRIANVSKFSNRLTKMASKQALRKIMRLQDNEAMTLKV